MSIILNSYGVADGVLTVDSTATCPDASWLLSFIYITCDASEDYADNAVVKEFFSVDGTGRVNNNAQMHMLSARRISSIPLAIWPNGSLTFTVRATYFDATPAPHYEYETGPSFTITNTDYIAPSVSPLSPFQEGAISKPITLTFDAPATIDAAEIPVTVAAVDDNAVTAYLVNESATPPLATAPGWSATAPTTYTVSTPGAHTLYAWAKDADGNVSDPVSAAVTATFTPVNVDATTGATGSESAAQAGTATATGSGTAAAAGTEGTAQTGTATATGTGGATTAATGTESAAQTGTVSATGTGTAAATGTGVSSQIGQATATGGGLTAGFYFRGADGTLFALKDQQGRTYALR